MDNTQIYNAMQEQLKVIRTIKRYVRDIDSEYSLSILRFLDAAAINLDVAANRMFWVIREDN